MALPTRFTIIGLGGCGKSLIKKICEHDELLTSYLMESQKSLKIYTVDTATDEKNDDEKFMRWLNDEKIPSIRSSPELSDINAQGVVEGKHYDLPSIPNITGIQDLVSEKAIAEMQLSDDDVWWLDDEKHGISFEELCKINPNLRKGFGGGVYRMRSVSKATFIKASTVTNAALNNLFSGSGPVAIIVGLGGGTGSGIFIDLARKIRSNGSGANREIYLFAILPASTEGEDERMNAAVALSELEYLKTHDSAQDERLFDYVFVTSLEATGFTRIEESQHTEAVIDFSDAFPYQFMSVFVADKDYGALSTSPYCGFINLDSYVVEYPVEKLHDMERDLDDALACYQKIAEARSKVCSIITDFFNESSKQYPEEYKNSNAENPNREDALRYREMITDLRNMWNHSVAKSLKYETPNYMNDYVSYIPELIRYPDNLTEFSQLYNHVNRLYDLVCTKKNEDEFSNYMERDKRLLDVVKSILTSLDIIGEYYQKVHNISDPAVRQAFINVLFMKKDVNSFDIESKIKNMTNIDQTALEKKVADLRESVTSIRNASAAWQERISKEVGNKFTLISEYCEHENKRDEWTSFEQTFIDEIINKCRHSRGLIEKIQAKEMKAKRDILKSNDPYILYPRLPESDYPNSDEILFLKELDDLISKYCYFDLKYVIATHEKPGILQKKLNAEEAKSTRDNTFLEIQNKIKGKNGIHIMRQDIDPTIITLDKTSILSIFEEERKDLGRKIIIGIETGLSDVGWDALKESDLLEQLLSCNADEREITDALKDKIFTMVLGDNEELTQKTQELREAESALQACTSKIGFLNLTLEKLLKGTFEIRKTHTDVCSSLPSANKVYEFGTGVSRKYKYITGKMNTDVLSILNDDSTLASLDGSSAGENDLRALAGILGREYERLTDSQLLGVTSLVRQIPPKIRWLYSADTVVFFSRSRDLQKMVTSDSNKRQISERINDLTNVLPSVIFNECAKPWECGVAFIAAGNFLENLLGFERGSFYRKPYETHCHDVLHHVLMVDKGKYLVRSILDPTEATTLASDESIPSKADEVKATVHSLYTVKDISETLKGNI